MDQIRGGAQLKKAEPVAAAPSSSRGYVNLIVVMTTDLSCSGLLAQIQQGAQLRKVTEEEKEAAAAPAAGLDGLAGALCAALNARRPAVASGKCPVV